MEIESHDVAHLLNEQRIAGELEGLGAVRLQSESAPNSAHCRLIQSASLGQRTGAPVGRILGLDSKVNVSTCSTSSSRICRGAPGRASSSNPSQPRCRNRRRHFPTVSRVVPNCTAMAMSLDPPSLAKIILARWANACDVFGRRSHR